MDINNNIKTILSCQDGELKQIASDTSIYKNGTYYISKLFKNTSNYEIEQWANNIANNLEKNEDIKNNCDAEFRIYNDGNEKWNTGLLYIWVK